MGVLIAGVVIFASLVLLVAKGNEKAVAAFPWIADLLQSRDSASQGGENRGGQTEGIALGLGSAALPGTAAGTVPATGQSTAPDVGPSLNTDVNPVVNPVINPDADPAVNPEADPGDEQNTKSDTEPNTDPGFDSGAGSSTEPENPDNPEAWRDTFYHVPAGPPVSDYYFNDALFIGDSRVVGMLLYSGLTDSTFYAEKGISVQNLLSKEIVPQTGGGKMSISRALEQEQYGKIYIKVGLNELGWPYIQGFAKEYGKVVSTIRELQPTAIIYIQSILPVSEAKQRERGTIFTNERIAKFNEEIQKMCWQYDLHYLNVTEGLRDEKGCLPEAASWDGVHLNKEYCAVWLTYLKTHVVWPKGLPRL